MLPLERKIGIFYIGIIKRINLFFLCRSAFWSQQLRVDFINVFLDVKCLPSPPITIYKCFMLLTRTDETGMFLDLLGLCPIVLCDYEWKSIIGQLREWSVVQVCCTAHLHNRLICRHDTDHVSNDEHIESYS